MAELLITDNPVFDKNYPINIEFEELKGKTFHSILTSCTINEIEGDLYYILNEEILLAESNEKSVNDLKDNIHAGRRMFSNFRIGYRLMTKKGFAIIYFYTNKNYYATRKLYFKTY